MPSGMTVDELLAEVDRIELASSGKDGVTTREVAEALGSSLATARDKIRKLLEAGQMERSPKKRDMMGIDGRRVACVAQFRLVKKSKAKRRKK